ncbi:MAG: bifunctional nuclease family protein [Desulfobacteraceae bacterium]|nr:MAG: bifunctional nuclease family protein [Desulfobacteraceae bacterium]
MLHEVNIAGLTLDQATNTPILILKSVDDHHSIPIWIGLLEATAIASVLQEINFDRPMTHDLFKNFIRLMKAEIVKIEVSDLKENTFYAKIHFMSGDKNFDMDARPSDAIALALRFKAPIFIDDKVIEKFGAGDIRHEAVDESEEGKKWAEYLEKLNPDDFGKYKV